jgi:hypothetical protein
MKKIYYFLSIISMIVIFSSYSHSQILDSMFVYKTEEPQKEDSIKYNKAWGMDLIASENGFGLGGFFRRQFTDIFSGAVSIVFSEGKDSREMEYVDYYGNTYTPYKKTRVMMIPLTASFAYRVFKESIIDTFRPYVNGGVGPVILMTTPYEKEFFSALKYAQAKYTVGGFIGAGANFGIDKKNLMGLNIRYYYIPYSPGIEVLESSPKKSFGGIYLTINFGINY